MALNTKAIKNRIGSVKNTKKITKAMQMVAAAKMRKAVDTTLRTKAYSNMNYELIQKLGQDKIEHPLALIRPKVRSELLVVISSNRGLCGAFNNHIQNKLSKFVSNRDSNIPLEVIAIGKKIGQYAKRQGLNVVALYDQMQDNPIFEDVLPITRTLVDNFCAEKYDKVTILYTNYISGLNQKVDEKQILPIVDTTTNPIEPQFGSQADTHTTKTQKNVKKQGFISSITGWYAEDKSEETIEEFDDYDEEIDNTDSDYVEEDREEKIDTYLLEPDRQTLIDYIVPRIVEIQVYQTVLESAASEHASRMVAMKSASESASEMIDTLTLEFNKARQAAITQEVSEVVGGAAALG